MIERIKSNRMNIYLIRHARQSSALCNVNVILSEEGKQQAKLLSKRMKDYPLDALYSSHLLRAVETAEYINEYHDLKHEVREGLEEIDFGELTGHDDDYVFNNFSEFFKETATMEKDLPYPGGESGQEVYERTYRVLQEVIESGKKEVAIVTHGGVIRALMAGILGMDQAKRAMFGASLENTSITKLVYVKEKGQFFVQKFNDYAHIEPYKELMKGSWKKSYGIQK